MFHPLAPARVAKLMPTGKLIVLLRDPVERAYSHWKERRTEGKEPLDFAEALAAEGERTAGERERLIADPAYFSEAYDWHTYRARGRYLEHLDAVAGAVRPDAAADHGERDALPGAGRFVREGAGLHRPAAARAARLRGLQRPPEQGMDAAVRAELSAFYAPHNAALAERLGMPFNWS